MSFYDNQPLTANSVLNEITSIPQELYQNDENLSSVVAGSVTNGKVIPGLTVFNNTNPGTVAYAAVPPMGYVNGDKAQRLICTINSNHQEPSSRIIDFTRKPDGLGAERDSQLFMHVYHYDHELMYSGQRGPVYKSGSTRNLIPLIVSPGSVSLAPPLTDSELDTLGCQDVSELSFDIGSILKGVVKSVPIIADAGVKIYQELSSTGSASERKGKEQVAFLPILGSIASIAAPLVGSLIKKVIE